MIVQGCVLPFKKDFMKIFKKEKTILCKNATFEEEKKRKNLYYPCNYNSGINYK